MSWDGGSLYGCGIFHLGAHVSLSHPDFFIVELIVFQLSRPGVPTCMPVIVAEFISHGVQISFCSWAMLHHA